MTLGLRNADHAGADTVGNENQDSGFFLFLCIVVNVWNASLLLGPDTFDALRARGVLGTN